MDTLQLACHEVEAWKVAQIVDTVTMAEENTGVIDHSHDTTAPMRLWRCQVDTSWMELSDGTGLGFVLYEIDTEVISGQCKGPQTSSPLHAEAESLCWVMKELSTRGLQQVSFES